MVDLLQLGSVDGDAVWEAVDNQGGLVSVSVRVARSVADVGQHRAAREGLVQEVEVQLERESTFAHVHASRAYATIQHDVHLCAYNALLRIIAKFHEEVFSDTSSPTGLNKVRRLN